VRESRHDDLHVFPVEGNPEGRVIAERVGKSVVEIPGRVADDLPFFTRDGWRLSPRGSGPRNRLRWGHGGGSLQCPGAFALNGRNGSARHDCYHSIPGGLRRNGGLEPIPLNQ
jgi:hypothetical protein